jgi:AP-4 complex subunit epsilon-1
MMLVNRLQRDLQSANVLECSIALTAAAKILTVDMIPAVLVLVVNTLKHDQEIIRKKSIMLLQRFHAIQTDSVAHLNDSFRRALCDKDPSVMGASLHLFADLAKADPSGYKDLVSSFVSILKQITEHRLPRDFDYHRIPAPWIQMKLLRILAILGHADQASSEQMYEVLLDVMRRADTGINVGYAIIYECVRTVTNIYPNPTLLDAAATAIGRFIQSDNHNLRYLGVTGLGAIVKDHPKYAAEHQLAVIDALEDPDETLKVKTLDLLYRMTNPVNVTVIVDKLISHLKSASIGDEFLRADLVTRITAAAERFAPSNSWYVSTMCDVFELGGDLVRMETAQNLIRLIGEGTGESEEADNDLRREAVETLITLLEKPAIPDILLQVMFWVLGEYGYLSTSMSLGTLTEKLSALSQRAGISIETRGYALNASLKLAAQCGALVPPAAALISKFSTSRYVDLAQRCYEFSALASKPHLMRAVLPIDASSEDLELDANLAFLDTFVSEALSAGAKPSSPPASEFDQDDGALSGHKNDGGLRFDAYASPDMNPSMAPGGEMGGFMDPAGGSNVFSSGPAAPFGVAKGGPWGKEGYKGGAAPAPAAPPPGPAQPALPDPTSYKRPWESHGSGSAALEADPSLANAPPARPPSPPKPRELTEKEKLAASLFGGVGAAGGGGLFGGTNVGGGMGARKPAAAPAPALAAAKAPVQAPAPAAALPTAAKPVAAPAPAPASNVDDLLGLSWSAPAPAAAPRNDFGDIFGAPATASAFNVVSGMGAMNINAGASAQPLDINSFALPQPLLNVVSAPGSIRSPSVGNVRVGGSADGSLVVASFKATAPDHLNVVVFIGNNAGAPTQPLSASFAVPPFLSLASAKSSTNVMISNAASIPVGVIPPRGNVSLVLTFALANVPVNSPITGTVGSAPVSLDVQVTDLIRPAQMDTPAFGGMWTQPTMVAEGVQVVQGSSQVKTPADLMARLGPLLGMHPVQMIPATSEAIAAGRVMGTQSIVLLHSRVGPTALEARVKTQDQKLTAAVLASIGVKLK